MMELIQVYHAATPDFDDKYERLGVRFTGIGERPYFDPATEDMENDIPLADRLNAHINGENGVKENGVNGHAAAIREAMAIH